MNGIAISLLLVCGLGALCSAGCASDPAIAAGVTVPYEPGTPVNVKPDRPEMDVDALCSSLKDLKRIPFELDEKAGDLVYDGIISKGAEAIPCLIERITDVTPMADPREAPHILDYTVGDTAVFMLHRVTRVPIEQVLPREIAAKWNDEGIYGYFRYVEEPDNRRQIRSWWKKWADDRLKRSPAKKQGTAL